MESIGRRDGVPRGRRGAARAALHPRYQPLAKQQGETQASAAGSGQRIAAQLLVVGGKILMRDGTGQRWIHRSFFLPPRRGGFTTSRWVGKPELLLKPWGKVARTPESAFRPWRSHKGEHFGRELVSLLGPSFVRDQRRQASLLESRLRLVKGGPREPEGGSRAAYWLPIALDAAQHLVLDLNQVAGIEKLVGQEQFVGD